MLPVPPRTRAGVTKIPEPMQVEDLVNKRHRQARRHIAQALPMVLFSSKHMTVNGPSRLLPVGLLSVLR